MTQRTVVFWNVQRLFGSSGSPIEYALSEDDAAAGASKEAIEAKLDVIAATLDLIAERAGPPLFVGLVEIENDALSRALAARVGSAELDSVDHLGEDRAGVALDGLNISALVDRTLVDDIGLLSSHVIDRTFNTRDVLECRMALKGLGPLTVLVNHWPSRLSAEGSSRRVAAAHYVNRLVAAQTRYSLQEMWDADRQLLDLPTADEMRQRARSPMIVMGDFNDEPFSPSIELLGSTNDPDAVRDDLEVKGRTKKERFRSYTASTPRLYNPWWQFVGRGGSYYRSPRWRLYDQIMPGSGLLQPTAPIRLAPDSAAILGVEHVRLPDGRSWSLLNRGGKPIAFDLDGGRGCSDHLPVYLQVTTEDTR
jgi:endonuclease/exonuclease/phosphatase family metal-dependent hydrolase